MEYHLDYRTSLFPVDSTSRKRILSCIAGVLAKIDNPRLLGKALTGNFGEFWRYRTGNFKIICNIDDDRLIVLVVKVAHRKDAYED